MLHKVSEVSPVMESEGQEDGPASFRCTDLNKVS